MEASLILTSVPIRHSNKIIVTLIHSVYTYNVEIELIAVINAVLVLLHPITVFHVLEIEYNLLIACNFFFIIYLAVI